VSIGKKMLWGGLGWALGGPIGAIVGYTLAGMSGQQGSSPFTSFGGYCRTALA